MTTPHAPAPLPRSARAMLTAYRDAHEIPAAIDERIWSVVGADDAPEPAFDPLEAAAPRRTSARRIAWGGATLAAAAMLLLAWRMGSWVAERRASESAPSQAIMHGAGGAHDQATTRAPHRTAPSSSTPAAAPEPAVEPPSATTEPASAPGAVDTTATSRPRRAAPELSKPPEPEPEPKPGSTLAAEVALVAQARRALAAGHNTETLDVTAEHARRFAHGVLVPERVAIETIARCRMGDGDRPQHAAAFHRAHPDSPFAARVDEACGVAPREERPSP